MKVVALVLAAGRSVRFGSDKRRAALADGRSLLVHSVERACSVFGDVRVVLREGERAEDLGLPAGCRVIASPQARLGMGHSLAAGVASLADSDAQAVAILLGDMPWIEPATLRLLAETATASTIVLRTGITARWTAIAGYAAAAVILLGSHLVDWTFLVFPLWVLIVSCDILLREYRPVEGPR